MNISPELHLRLNFEENNYEIIFILLHGSKRIEEICLFEILNINIFFY